MHIVRHSVTRPERINFNLNKILIYHDRDSRQVCTGLGCTRKPGWHEVAGLVRKRSWTPGLGWCPSPWTEGSCRKQPSRQSWRCIEPTSFSRCNSRIVFMITILSWVERWKNKLVSPVDVAQDAHVEVQHVAVAGTHDDDFWQLCKHIGVIWLAIMRHARFPRPITACYYVCAYNAKSYTITIKYISFKIF